MSKRILAIFLSAILILSVISEVSFSAYANGQKDTEEAKAVLLGNTSSVDGVVEARFENMLNHNYIYGEEFLSDRAVIEGAIISLIDFAENGEIDKNLVLNYIANMYGLQVDENEAVYDFAPASEGKFTVLPRGYNPINHNILSVTETESAFIVVSKMTTYTHDGGTETSYIKSVFVANAGSCYGYNILSSDYIDEGNAI